MRISAIAWPATGITMVSNHVTAEPARRRERRPFVMAVEVREWGDALLRSTQDLIQCCECRSTLIANYRSSVGTRRRVADDMRKLSCTRTSLPTWYQYQVPRRGESAGQDAARADSRDAPIGQRGREQLERQRRGDLSQRSTG